MELFEFYNFKFTLVNVIDVLLVAGFIHQLYRILKGSLAFNMLIGLVTIYIFWMVVRYFNMPLLETILGEVTKFGFLAIIIIFQQEIRKFLLLLGKISFLAENKSMFRFLPWNWKIEKSFHTNFEEIVDACEFLAETNQGAIIVFPKTSEMKFIGSSGEVIDAHITRRLLISIFNKYSPLHDGAVIIANSKIKAANAVLPVSENPELLNKYGMRHLSAIGITEQTDAVVLVVSEEKGTIAFAKEGKLIEGLTKSQITDLLNKEFVNDMVRVD
ncbi:MAG: diadenylate cyclase CdaA [Bacteroidota bacterium]